MHKIIVLFLCAFFVLDCGRQASSSQLGHTLHHILQRLSEETNDPSWEKAVHHHDHVHRHNNHYDYESTVDSKAPYTPQVQTSQGLVHGRTEIEAHAFYSIPFAEQPIGSLRFQPPNPLAETVNGFLDASVYKQNYCFQRPEICRQGKECLTNFTEACLVLNVNVPKTVDLSNATSPPSAGLPVLVWIHGGFFMFGSGSDPRSEARFLTEVTDAIIVRANYRLGVFGFMAYDENGEVVRGNQGLDDQRLALQWVQDNIEKFGGDKNKVAIMGESSGAQAIMFHLMSQKSKHLFSSAILMSNPAGWQYQTFEESLIMTEALINNTGCVDQRIECLRQMDAAQLVRESDKLRLNHFQNRYSFGVFEPNCAILDGVEFKEDPMKVFQSGAWHKDKAVIMGTTADEIYFSAYWPTTMSKQLYETACKFFVGEEIDEKVAAFYEEFAEGTGLKKDYAKAFGMAVTDGLFICPVSAMARFASQTTTSNVYRYSFDHIYGDAESCNLSDINSKTCGVSTHAMDNMFLFRTFATERYIGTEADMQVANQYAYYWTNLAASNDPNLKYVSKLGNYSEWPAYTQAMNADENFSRLQLIHRQRANDQSWLNLQVVAPTPNVRPAFHRDFCDFWDSLGFYVAPTVPSSSTTTPEATTTIQEATTTPKATTTIQEATTTPKATTTIQEATTTPKATTTIQEATTTTTEAIKTSTEATATLTTTESMTSSAIRTAVSFWSIVAAMALFFL